MLYTDATDRWQRTALNYARLFGMEKSLGTVGSQFVSAHMASDHAELIL